MPGLTVAPLEQVGEDLELYRSVPAIGFNADRKFEIQETTLL